MGIPSVPAHKVFVIGGEAIFKLALPLADRIYLTEVDAEPDGDAYFPELDANDWRETSAEQYDAGNGNDFACFDFSDQACSATGFEGFNLFGQGAPDNSLDTQVNRQTNFLASS